MPSIKVHVNLPNVRPGAMSWESGPRTTATVDEELFAYWLAYEKVANLNPHSAHRSSLDRFAEWCRHEVANLDRYGNRQKGTADAQLAAIEGAGGVSRFLQRRILAVIVSPGIHAERVS